MFANISQWLQDQYWKIWQVGHGIDPENPPKVDIESLYDGEDNG